MRTPSKVSTLKRPEKTVDPVTGRITYEGSLSQQTTELTAAQKDKGLKLLKTGAHMPTELIEELGLSPYSPHSGESVRRWIAELEKNCHVKAVKDDRNKLIGWQSTEEPEAKE
jgi:hypothetical protein